MREREFVRECVCERHGHTEIRKKQRDMDIHRQIPRQRDRVKKTKNETKKNLFDSKF